MVSREKRIRQVEEAVNQLENDVSVKALADKLDLSKSYVRELAKEALEKGLIEEPVTSSTTSREDRLKQVEDVVNKRGGDVSVKDLAGELDLSKSYIRDLTEEARNQGLIDGAKSVPVLGYIFNNGSQARTDGGNERSGDLRVLPTRESLLQAVRDYAPQLYPEAQGKTLEELRKLVRNRVADGVTPVSHAWRFEPA
jgi:Mn-dependent DtxR family transcriptional regulator